VVETLATVGELEAEPGEPPDPAPFPGQPPPPLPPLTVNTFAKLLAPPELPASSAIL
jgi:hypothetical protein